MILFCLLVALSSIRHSFSLLTKTTIPPNLKIALTADMGTTMNACEVQELIREENASFVLHAGDIGYGDASGWFEMTNSILGENYPYYAAVGDHEDMHDETWFGDYVPHFEVRPSFENCEGGFGDSMICSVNGILFVLSGVGLYGENHADFIRESFAQYSFTDYPWRICVFHLPEQELCVEDVEKTPGFDIYEACRRSGAFIVTGEAHTYSRSHLISRFHPTNTTVVSSSLTTGDSLDNPMMLERGHTLLIGNGCGGKIVRSYNEELIFRPWWAATGGSQNNWGFGAVFCNFNSKTLNGEKHYHMACSFKDTNRYIKDFFHVKSLLHEAVQPPRNLNETSNVVPGPEAAPQISPPSSRSPRSNEYCSCTGIPICSNIFKSSLCEDKSDCNWECVEACACTGIMMCSNIAESSLCQERPECEWECSQDSTSSNTLQESPVSSFNFPINSPENGLQISLPDAPEIPELTESDDVTETEETTSSILPDSEHQTTTLEEHTQQTAVPASSSDPCCLPISLGTTHCPQIPDRERCNGYSSCSWSCLTPTMGPTFSPTPCPTMKTHKKVPSSSTPAADSSPPVNPERPGYETTTPQTLTPTRNPRSPPDTSSSVANDGSPSVMISPSVLPSQPETERVPTPEVISTKLTTSTSSASQNVTLWCCVQWTLLTIILLH